MYVEYLPFPIFSVWQKSLALSEIKLVPQNDIILHNNPYSPNMILQLFMSCSVDRPSALLLGIFVAIYNTREMAAVEGKYVSAYFFPWFASDSWGSILFLGFICWHSIHVEHHFISSMYSFMLSQYRDSCVTNHVFSMPKWLLWRCYKACGCYCVGIMIHLLPFHLLSYICSVHWPSTYTTCF